MVIAWQGSVPCWFMAASFSSNWAGKWLCPACDQFPVKKKFKPQGLEITTYYNDAPVQKMKMEAMNNINESLPY